MVHEEEKEILAPIPISSTPFIPPASPKTNPIKQPTTANIPQNIPLAVQYPLELLAIQHEMTQFYKDDNPSKRTFPSLQGFSKPQNIDEYLKMKTKQPELIAKHVSKGKGDKNYQGTYQYELSKVRKLEDFARDLSKSISELPPYKASRSQFNGWSLEALKEEQNRIKMMNKDP
ncbi:hypothetical protein Hanom_Chr03g00197131 [Helianthus anomalus]